MRLVDGGGVIVAMDGDNSLVWSASFADVDTRQPLKNALRRKKKKKSPNNPTVVIKVLYKKGVNYKLRSAKEVSSKECVEEVVAGAGARVQWLVVGGGGVVVGATEMRRRRCFGGGWKE